MHRHKLSLSSSIIIAQRDGRLYAGWLSTPNTIVFLDDIDVVLLSVFRASNLYPDVIGEAITRVRGMLSLSVKPQQIADWIEKMTSNRVLVATGDTADELASTESPFDIDKLLADKPGTIVDRTRQLRLSKNFLLKPVPNGFQGWSPTLRSHYTLSVELTLILTSFSMEKKINSVIKERKGLRDVEPMSQAIAWFRDNGLLIEVQKGIEPSPSNSSPNIGRQKKHKKMVKSARSKNSKTSDFQAKDKLNGRTPIYFVPHMVNHYPLALGLMYSYIQQYKGGALLEKYMLVPITYMTQKDFVEGPYRKYGKGIWLFSNYMWSVDLNLQISQLIKQHNFENITLHGGPSTPSYEAACSSFLTANPSVDVAIHGEGEATIAELLEVLAEQGTIGSNMAQVQGITFRGTASVAGGPEVTEYIRAEPRPRVSNLDGIPSPYLTGVFDSYGGHVEAAIVESNRGCPFGCTFCDWGSATNQKIRKFDLQRVKDEIEWIGMNQVRVLWIADANFGIYDRDIELSEWISEIKKRHGYPKEVVVNYTKNATKRLTSIVKVFAANGICSQGIISIQTRDESTLEVINRKNIKTDKYNDLSEIFKIEGLPLSTDLMIGLPGITIESFKQDLQYYLDKDVMVKAYPTQLLPNSPMADPEYIQKYKIEVDSENFLISCFSYSKAEFVEMTNIYTFYAVAENFSTLRYVLRYLQWEHSIPALDFLHKLLLALTVAPEQYPAVSFVMSQFVVNMSIPGGWHQFYDEISSFSESAFGVDRDSGFNAVLRFNEVVMPDDALSYPVNEFLEHDVISYFADRQLNALSELLPLNAYPSAEAVIEDKYLFAQIDYTSQQYDTHQIFWELQTPVSRNQSVPNFR